VSQKEKVATGASFFTQGCKPARQQIMKQPGNTRQQNWAASG